MCGIVGGVGNLPYKDFVLKGLKRLDYRGYDSAGMAFLSEGRITNYRTVGSVEDLARKVPSGIVAHAGIGHTRWATHGRVCVENAHPQFSFDNRVYLCHNGVIDNYKELKEALKKKGIFFRSDTDSEVIASLIADFLTSGMEPLEAIYSTLHLLDGSYALAILIAGRNELFFAKNRSPMVIGRGRDGYNCLASDFAPLIDECDEFAVLDDRTYGVMTEKGITAYNRGEECKLHFASRDKESFNYDLCGFPHFMLKEIHEGPTVVRKDVGHFYDAQKGYLFDENLIKEAGSAGEIVFLACGSSHYASEAAAAYFNMNGYRAVSYIASEWIHGVYPRGRDALYVLVSQSGETADLISCLDRIERHGKVLAIVNAKDSTIARRSDYVLNIDAGLEVAVASTKSFLGQLATMMLLCGALKGDKSVPEKLLKAAESTENVVARNGEIDEISEKVLGARDCFFVGRAMDFFSAEESSLKLKEISYVHSEAYPGGELKHGPIALIEKDTPVFAFAGNPELSDSLRSNVEEMLARGAVSYIVSSSACTKDGDAFVYRDVEPSFNVFPEVAFGQLLSYYLSLRKGLNVDKPRNLAKSVTVN